MVEPIDVECNTESDTYQVSCQCVNCHKIVNFTMPGTEMEGLIEYLYKSNRRTIQECLPNVYYKYREMLISGTCPECWDLMFKPMDEEN